MKEIRFIVGALRGPGSWRSIALACFMGMLLGCGQKGPLYLPAPAATHHPAPTAPAEDSTSNDRRR